MSIHSNTEILYFYDALCGWCYGFSPVMRSLHAKYKDEMRFRVFAGGMMMGDRMGSINSVAPYIKEGAYQAVEKRTGVKFGEKFINEVLEPGTAILSSLEPAIALAVFKSFESGRDIEYASDLQKAIYYDAVPSNDLSAFVPYAVELGIDEREFRIRLNDPVYHDRAYDDFRTTQRFGVQGFPCTVLLHEDKYYMLGSGYTDLATIEARIEQVLSEAVAK